MTHIGSRCAATPWTAAFAAVTKMDVSSRCVHALARRRASNRRGPSGNVFVEVTPLRVQLLNETNFPLSVPALHLLFSKDGIGYGGVNFVMYQYMDTVSLREAFDRVTLMLPYPTSDIAGDANI